MTALDTGATDAGATPSTAASPTAAPAPRPIRRPRPRTIALLVTVVTAGTYVAGASLQARATEREAATLGPGHATVVVDLEHSRFVPDRLRVRAGTLVSFEVVNHDPIHHEFVLGPSAVHHAHAHGTERFHPPVPGEVSTGPHESGMTFYAFDEPGTVAFACHLPGHVAYGMVGEVEVVP